MAPQIRRAQRRKAKLRLALIGPTGSGKTYSALRLAFGMGGKVGVVDTENGSADLYADLGEYDVITLEAPYTVAKYREAITAFEQAGYNTIIVDSLSHAWSGEGGLLDKSNQIQKRNPGANSFAAWREITPEHNKLVEELLNSPCHIIATMRAKTEYVLEVNEKGKQVPRKIGLSPVQRDGVEYEFSLVMDVDQDHKASASKDRTSQLNGWYDQITEDTGRKLMAWLDNGVDAPQQAAPAPPPPDMEGDVSTPFMIRFKEGPKYFQTHEEWVDAWKDRLSKIIEPEMVDRWMTSQEKPLRTGEHVAPQAVGFIRSMAAMRKTELQRGAGPKPAEPQVYYQSDIVVPENVLAWVNKLIDHIGRQKTFEDAKSWQNNHKWKEIYDEHCSKPYGRTVEDLVTQAELQIREKESRRGFDELYRESTGGSGDMDPTRTLN